MQQNKSKTNSRMPKRCRSYCSAIASTIRPVWSEILCIANRWLHAICTYTRSDIPGHAFRKRWLSTKISHTL